jgi:hexosaminidase
MSYAANRISVVPKPYSIAMGNGFFLLSQSTRISSSDNLEDLAAYLIEQLSLFTHLRLQETDPFVSANSRSAQKSNVVALELAQCFCESSAEAYELCIDSANIILKSKTKAGLFRGIQTLLQLIPIPREPQQSTGNSVPLNVFKIPCCRIKDYPRFGWRGFNLDCVRHFMSKDFIKRYIDLLAYYKFNIFHWHLTDDQGWRIEIKRYPKLTEIGAWRKETDGPFGPAGSTDSSAKYGGYYTQDDVTEIVNYAESRFITVVPEIEMPGHCEASLASYPENACVDGPFTVGTQWGVYKDIYCPAKESTFVFLENILKEVLTLFPSRYIHIGGDEVPKVEWKESSLCKQLMNEKGLKDEEELQSYFIRRIQRFLKLSDSTTLSSDGREIVGWDEILEGNGPDSGAVVESWRGIEGALQAAKNGMFTIVSPEQYTYLSRSPEDLTIDSVYLFDPMPPGLTQEEQKFVLGIEASLWTEHAPQETVDSKVFPRILAVAEDGWTAQTKKNLAGFHRRLESQYDRLSYLGVDYGLERKAMSFHTKFDNKKRGFIVTLVPAQKNIRVRYVINDTLAISNSKIYTCPLFIGSNSILIARAEMKNHLVGDPVTLSFILSKALNSKVIVKNSCSPHYAAQGDNSLVDGVRGTTNFRDGLWQGYQGTDVDATIDFGKEEVLSEVGAGFYQESQSWIFMPDSVEYYASLDGVDFRKIGVVRNDIPQDYPDPIKRDFILRFEKRTIRYIRIVAKNIGVCPPWHPGAGGKAWLFIDEIYAN